MVKYGFCLFAWLVCSKQLKQVKKHENAGIVIHGYKRDAGWEIKYRA